MNESTKSMEVFVWGAGVTMIQNSAHNAMHPAARAVWADQPTPASTLSLDTVMPGPGLGGDDAGLERMKVGLSHNIDKLAKNL